ncbi:MAG TPA: TRAP transporter small permease [Burkholderiaceae bacterium]|nr:TRAP transporter small permease [Burkholderiaceae bacterium]
MQGKPRPQWEEGVAVASMALLVVITLLNVLTRYFTDESFAWTEELSVFLMVVMTLAGASAVAQRDRHIRIEFLLSRRRAGEEAVPRRGLWLFGALATSLVFMLLAVLFGRWVWDQYRFSETSMGLGVPLWWYGAAIAPLCLAIAARAFSAFVRLLRHESPGAGDSA